MKRFFMLTLMSIGLGWGNGGLGGTIDPQVPDHKYLEYGAKFTCVGQLCGMDTAGKISVGSCVAVRPKIIITAAHVVHDLLIAHVHINGKELNVLKMVVCPEYAGGFGKGDVAICFLSSSADLKFYPALYTKSDETGKIACMAGYGMTGTFATGAIKGDGKRRAGSNYIDSIIDDVLVCSPSIVNKKTSLEYMIAPGDSGGGLFIDTKLAGINSCVLHPAPKDKSTKTALGKYGHEGCHTRISVHAKWIEEVIDLHESGYYGNKFLPDAPAEDTPQRCEIVTDATAKAELPSADR